MFNKIRNTKVIGGVVAACSFIFILFFVMVSCSDEEYKLPAIEPILGNGTWYRTNNITSSNDDFGALTIIKTVLKLEHNSFKFYSDNTYDAVNWLGNAVSGVWYLEDNSVLYLNEGTDQEIIYTIKKADDLEMEWELYYSGEMLGTSKDAYVYIIMHIKEHDYSEE